MCHTVCVKHFKRFCILIFFSNRSKKMLIKMIWVIHVVRLVRPAPDVFDCHRSMRKQKCASVKHCRKIYKNNKCMAAIQQYANIFRVQLQVLHLHRCRAWKSLIHKQLKDQPIQTQNTFRIPPDFYQLAKEPLRVDNQINWNPRRKNMIFVHFLAKINQFIHSWN